MDQIQQVLGPPKKQIQFNYRPLFVFIHFIMFTVYLLTKDSYFYQSFYSPTPFFFYGLLIVYMIMIRFYSKACCDPGFAADESDAEKVEDEANLDPNRFYCKYCKIYVPIRASHCSMCKKCVIRRDHHCPWTNNCIGRDNHFYFFIFVFLEFFSQSIPDSDAIYHFSRYIFYVKDHQHFCQTIIPYLLLIIASTFGTFMAFRLAFSCIMVITHNLTTWEGLRRDRITYLKNLPYGYSPFDRGLINNIIEFCTMREKKMKWEIKQPNLLGFSQELTTFFSRK